MAIKRRKRRDKSIGRETPFIWFLSGSYLVLFNMSTGH
jgi:hypothetical protein